MTISEPYYNSQKGKVKWCCDVTQEEDKKTLWYSVDEKYSNLLADRSNAALVGLLIPAMHAGEDIYVKGSISERLYYNCMRSLQSALQQSIPSLKKIKIIPESARPDEERAVGVATGFSGGIDSFSVLADHHFANNVPDGFRLSHLLFNNVGAHDSGGEALFKARLNRVQSVAEGTGLEVVTVNSNLYSFYRDFNFVKVHTMCNGSVPFVLQKGIGKFMYGSAYHYRDISVRESTDAIAKSDPILLPLLSTTGLDLLAHVPGFRKLFK